MSDELLNADELASVLDVRPATVRKWARDGLIPSIRLSAKTIRFCYGDVLAALRELATQRNREGTSNE